ncbi:MAG: DUF3817 domain-containing protein [Phycisphaerales bacterium]|nr:DUF3817 domain-containing protein [Phycisphaerales bacterium]
MDEQRTDDPRPINRIYLIWLIIAGLIEGTSTLILFFVAMPMKYWMGMPEVVSIVGMIHGVLFVGLVAMFLIARFVVPISWWLVFLGFIGAIVPFGPFLVDLKLAAILRRDDADRARR